MKCQVMMWGRSVEVVDSQVVVDLSCMAWKEGQNRKYLSVRDMRGTASLTCFDFVTRNYGKRLQSYVLTSAHT